MSLHEEAPEAPIMARSASPSCIVLRPGRNPLSIRHRTGQRSAPDVEVAAFTFADREALIAHRDELCTFVAYYN